MGKSDTMINAYLSAPDRCADFIQNLVCHNQMTITEDMLQIKNTRQPLLLKKDGRRLQVREKYRDILACVCHECLCLIIGIENQKNLSNIMPVRTLSYDGGHYEEQVRAFQNQYRKERELVCRMMNDRGDGAAVQRLAKMEKEDFLSGIRGEDRLTPVATFVFYYGEEKWNRARELYDILDFGRIDKRFRPYIQNYKINLIDIHDIGDVSGFRTDLGAMIELMKFRNDKTQMKSYIASHQEFFARTRGDAYDLVAELMDSQWLVNEKKKYLEKEGSVYDMCTGMKEWLAEVESDGFAKGESSGFAKGESSGFAKGESSGFTKGITASLDVIDDARHGETPAAIASKYQMDLKDVMVIIHRMNL